ncbi:MAG: ATP-binding protein [Actinomycetota bacterium]
MTIVLVAVAVLVGLAIGHQLGRRSASARAEAAERVRVDAAARETRRAERKVQTDIERALADLRLGVVVVDGDGEESYRNNQATQYKTGRHGDVLVEAALGRVLEGALLGLSLEESVEVYGPPARSLLVQAAPTYDGGEPNGAVGVIEDVTEARHIDRVRSDFVANVSHELRTPVGAMSVLAETIADAADPETIARLTSRMQREANRLSETIDDLLILSRLESGPVIDEETVDLVSVVTMAVERTAEAAAHRRVPVTVENLGATPILVDGDQGQLVSAVANLLDNAIKYSDAGTSVSVTVEAVPRSDTVAPVGDATLPVQTDDAVPEPSARLDGDLPEDRIGTAELVITDAGIGIPDRDLDRIFERFYRVDTARSRETGGTGLGLSIVRNAIRNHRGSIEVTSVEGQGSTFTVRLPVSETQTQLFDESASLWTN